MVYPQLNEHDPGICGQNTESRRCVIKSAKNSGHYRDNSTEFASQAILKWANDNSVDLYYIDPG